ncbi:MAG: threonine synthase [Alphaproteobacteria bacterium]|nr:threonine synthase [Alphaproteobacteria bacterium]
MNYISTRGGGQPQNFENVLLRGLAPDGGLYVPESWPSLNIKELRGKSYQDIAETVMFPFIEGSIDRKEFHNIVNETYSMDIFRHEKVVPLHHLKDNLYILEQFHGPTIAFKDVALQLLGRLFDTVLKKHGKRVTIIGATSGDTGSAAIEGCRHSEQVDIFILHPEGRVSDVQRKQMTTINAPNVHNIALDGTFDDCQNMVKAMFNDVKFRDDMNLSAVNSINWARIMAQIVYYVTSAIELGAPEKSVTYVIPTGNFGNVFAAYCARKMGLPIKIVVATNENDILTRFFESGEMKISEVIPTISPSMDIGISSNFERFLFDLLERDAQALSNLMRVFKDTGSYCVSVDLIKKAGKQFHSMRCDEKQTLETIRYIYEGTGYTLDPHTAVAMYAALNISENEENAVVTLATAHPAKFPEAVKKATGSYPELPAHLSDLFDKKEYLTKQPNNLQIVQEFIREHSRITK